MVKRPLFNEDLTIYEVTYEVDHGGRGFVESKAYFIIEDIDIEAALFLAKTYLDDDDTYILGIKYLSCGISDTNLTLSRQSLWADVDDRLPTPKCDVLVTDGHTVCQAYMESTGEWFGAIHSSKVTHWQPMPELPKRDD